MLKYLAVVLALGALAMLIAVLAILLSAVLSSISFDILESDGDAFGWMGALIWGLLILVVGAGCAWSRIWVFRARSPQWWPLLLMVALNLLWMAAAPAINEPLAKALHLHDGGAALDCILLALWVAAQYILQRFAIFRKTIDTL